MRRTQLAAVFWITLAGWGALAGCDGGGDSSRVWPGPDRSIPLHEARRIVRISAWLDGGGDVNREDGLGRSELVLACRDGQAHVIALLLERGADPAVSWQNPLAIASRERHDRIVGMLLDSGAVAANSREWQFGSPLGAASTVGHAEIARLLLDAGAAIDARGEFGCTPLHKAAQHASDDVVAVLLTAGANVNLTNRAGRTPLHETGKSAAQVSKSQRNADLARRVKIARRLVDAGADVGLADNWGNRPLHYAAGAGSRVIVKMLLEAGADPDTVSDWGLTPADHAYRNGFDDLGRWLENLERKR